MAAKTFVCRCEDVLLSDIVDSMKAGYRNIEEIKRYTGFGTGPCQGKECVVHVARMIATAEPGQALPVLPFTTRPPISPTPLKYFAGAGSEQVVNQKDEDEGDLHAHDEGMAGG